MFNSSRVLNSTRSLGRLAVLWAATISACSASAAGGQTVIRRAAAVPSRRHVEGGQIDLQKSRVYVFVDKTGLGHQHAVVGRLKDGRLRIAKNGAGYLVFDMATFAADSKDARRYVGLKGEASVREQEQVTATMAGAEILDVEHFPTATFTVNSMQAMGRKGGKAKFLLDGQFTLRGVTQPLQIAAEGADDGAALHFSGSFSLRQTQYKIRPYKKVLGAVGVADLLKVYGEIWVKK